jgi:uncharacterized membrane protein
MKLDLKKELPLFILALTPILYLMYVWNILPEQVPTHYNFSGEADRFSGKTGFAILISSMTFFTYGLMLVLPYIDPKKQIANMGKKFYQVKFIMVGLMVSLCWFIIYKTIHQDANIQFMMVIIGGFLFALGNYFQTIKQNYFLGVRTPWALNNEENWRNTHKVSGKVWMIGGLALVVSYFVFPLKLSININLAIIAILAIVPVAYSFYHFRYKEND